MKLKPCPFCGEKEHIILHNEMGLPCISRLHSVECGCCGVVLGRAHTEKKAIFAWNKRVK